MVDFLDLLDELLGIERTVSQLCSSRRDHVFTISSIFDGFGHRVVRHLFEFTHEAIMIQILEVSAICAIRMSKMKQLENIRDFIKRRSGLDGIFCFPSSSSSTCSFRGTLRFAQPWSALS